MKVRQRLAALSGEIAGAQTNARILEEQLAYLDELAEDARIRALVSETPLAHREHREAQDDADRARRSLGDAQERVAELRTEQDRLLERLLESG